MSSSTPPSTPSPPLSNFESKSSAQSADERDFTEPRKGLIHPEPILPVKAPLPLHLTGPEPTRQSDNQLLSVLPPRSPSRIEIPSLTHSHPNPSRELNTFPVSETTSPHPVQPRPDAPLNLESQKKTEGRPVTPTRPPSLPRIPVPKQIPTSSSQTNSSVLSPAHTPLHPSSLPQSESQFQSPLSSKCHPLIAPPSLSLPLHHSFPPHLPPPPHLTPLPPNRPDHVPLTRFPPEPVSESQVPPSHPPELVSIKQERQSPPCQSPKLHIDRLPEESTLSNPAIPDPPPLSTERISSNPVPKPLERESTLPFRPHLLPLLETTVPDSLKSDGSQQLTPGAPKMDQPQSLMSDIKIKTEPVEITPDEITEEHESDDDIPTGPEPEPTTCNKKIHESKSAMYVLFYFIVFTTSNYLSTLLPG